VNWGQLEQKTVLYLSSKVHIVSFFLVEFIWKCS